MKFAINTSNKDSDKKGGIMIRSTKGSSTFWLQTVRSNPFPATTVPNFSLGKTATSLAIYVPMYMAEENVNFVSKLKTPIQKGREGFDLTKSSEMSKSMDGSGMSKDENALLHPIKVYLTPAVNFLLISIFRSPVSSFKV